MIVLRTNITFLLSQADLLTSIRVVFCNFDNSIAQNVIKVKLYLLEKYTFVDCYKYKVVNLLDFYNYYLSLCNRIGMKPSPAGEAAGFSRTAVNGWKRGHLPTDSNLQKLSEFFNVPVSEFHECNDIKARDIKSGIKAKLEEITESNKKTATSGDGREMTVNDDINSFANSLFIRLPIEKKILLINQMQAELQTQEAQDVQ